MSKSIGMLLDAFYPSDIRVEKEATALINAGFKVSLICKRREGEAYREQISDLNVFRIDAGKSHSDKGWIDILTSISFINPYFKKRLGSFIDEYNIDFLHIHDLPLVKTARTIAKKYNIKVISDFHENYPEALKVWFQWKKNPFIRLKNKIFFSYKRWHRYERWAVQQSDKVIAVVEEMQERLVSDHDVNSNKIEVITNTENKDFVNQDLNKEIYGDDKDKFILAYTGGVGPHRGVDTAIEAMSLLKDHDDIVLYITGTASNAAIQMMNSMIKRYALEENVKVLGYRPFSEFYSFMKMASVNLIPHHRNDHTDNTVPHKLYQCMMVGNPVLVSDVAPLERVVGSTRSGMIFKAGSAKDLATKILYLYSNPEERIELGKNGVLVTVEGELNWEKTSEDLVKMYRAL